METTISIVHNILQSMSNYQSVSAVIFQEVVDLTAAKSHGLRQFQSRKPKMDIQKFWRRLVGALEIQQETEKEALRILWRISRGEVQVSRALIYKISTVSLILAHKLHEDQTHTLESFSLLSGVPIKELHSLQLQVFNLLDFRLLPSVEESQSMPRLLLTLSL